MMIRKYCAINDGKCGFFKKAQQPEQKPPRENKKLAHYDQIREKVEAELSRQTPTPAVAAKKAKKLILSK